ncbi:MAG: hypothetical protein V9G11_08235 [Bifidobacterium adolescentis]
MTTTGKRGVGGLELGEQVEALLAGGGVAGVVEVDEGEGEVACLDGLQHGGRGFDRLDEVTLGFQKKAQGFKNIGLVVCHQDAVGCGIMGSHWRK